MMKLILSLTLIWTLSSTAEAVECWTGPGFDTKQQILTPCNSTELCATVALQGMSGESIRNTIRMCLPSSVISEGKHTYSFNVGIASMAASIHVCNTDGCNSQAIPYPGVQKENNLQCFTCHPLFAACDMTVQCVGEQDRCFSGTVGDDRSETFPTFGCVSANLCEIVSLVKDMPEFHLQFHSGPECCGSSFCNSAWSVKLNVIPLLFGIITLIVY